ncbi:MAG: hypothetical protein LBL94_08985 [Prevotellaceae bacterium]|jgi:hypothetical protein|nr:hypothetical protein [Prevotellaceae bacterium]
MKEFLRVFKQAVLTARKRIISGYCAFSLCFLLCIDTKATSPLVAMLAVINFAASVMLARSIIIYKIKKT